MPSFNPPTTFAKVKSVFGENKIQQLSKGSCKGDPLWEHDNLVVIRNAAGTGCNVQIHRLLAQHFEGTLKEAIGATGYKIKQLGGYCARHQRNDPALPLSLHSYGIAVDINWATNPMSRKLITDMPDEFVHIFEDSGWNWGGRWKFPDAMHFQYALGI